MFWTYEVPLFRWLVTKLSLVHFFGYCFCITQFIPRCSHAGCYSGNLLLKLSHPPLPLKRQSHTLALEYLVKNTFTTATVKSTQKKNAHNCMHCLHLTVTFSVSSIHQEKEIEASRKKYTYVNTTIISGLSHLFFLSLCCFARWTSGNKFSKQEARSEDPWGVYTVRSAAWASHKPLFSKAGCYCRNFLKSKLWYPHHKWSWGIKTQIGGESKLSVPRAIHP